MKPLCEGIMSSLKSYRQKTYKIPNCWSKQQFHRKRFKKRKKGSSRMHEEKVEHIFKFRDHCLCADAAHHRSLWGREWKEPTKPGNFTQEPPHTQFFPLPRWNGSLWHRLIGNGVKLSSRANSIFRSVLSFPGIAKLKWIPQHQWASHILVLRTVCNAEL
jgi:hypothetical protein